ncbi:MAG: hypothetical protein PVG98_04465 [Chromatiales bacterium]|jgi:hypothetical protein
MATRLVQKRLLSVQELELTEDSVRVRIKSPFKEEETLSVFLTVLNPEPVITESRLEFNSRVNGEPLISLYLAKPSAREFNAFVALIKERAQAAHQAFTGLRPGLEPGEPSADALEVPPELADADDFDTATVRRDVDVDSIDSSIRMLRTYIDSEDIAPLLSALEDLKADPKDPSHLARLANVFASLGAVQGAVLTYAPYIIVLLSDDPFGHKQA